MVRFNDDSFTITIPTGPGPQEYYRRSLDSLLQILKMQDPTYGDTMEYNFYLLDLLQSMVDVDCEPKKE